MKRSWKIFALVGLMFMSAGVMAGAQLGGLIKGGLIVVAVDKFGGQINNAINSLMGSRHVAYQGATKVVPILSLGKGGYAGAVQVAGPKYAVDKVKAVVQLETDFHGLGGVRLRALIPVSTKSATNIRRVNGVGVSAIIDFKL